MTRDSYAADRAALQHYHACYRQSTYRAFRDALATDLATHHDSTDSDLIGWMNQLTDAALGVAGHSNYADCPPRLAAALGQFRASDETLHAATAHLRHIEREGTPAARDFEVTAFLVRDLERLPLALTAAAEQAAEGHLAAHRAATHLLAAAGLLVRTAHSVLSRQVPSYAAEKARRACDHAAWGLQSLSEIDHDYAYAFRTLADSIHHPGDNHHA